MLPVHLFKEICYQGNVTLQIKVKSYYKRFDVYIVSVSLRIDLWKDGQLSSRLLFDSWLLPWKDSYLVH